MWAAIARGILKLGGWTPVVAENLPPKVLFIAAPHTSNWDAVWALVYKVAIGLDIHWFAKESLFWFPLDVLLRGLGGIPLDRKRAGSSVQQAVEKFRSKDRYYFGLAPEGTRSRADYWKSGFYRIAEAADVPIVLGFLDYGNKRLGMGPTIELSGNREHDLSIMREFYSGVVGRRPEQFGPIELRPERESRDTGRVRQHRPIRSYVRRAGRLTNSQRRALDECWPVYGIEYAVSRLDFVEVFGRAAPVVLEIGFGNGETLVEQATKHSDRDFVGIEVHEPGVGHCLIKIREAGLTNLKLVKHDAVEVLEKQVPSGALERVNLYFPDPWPKKRHHKRRLVQPGFIDLLAERLRSRGSLHIATDWENYAEHIDETFAATDRFRLVERRMHSGDRPLDRPRTKFERRGLRHGHAIWDWRFDRSD